MNKKLIIIICCCIFILLLGGCLLYKNPEAQLIKFEQALEKYGFKEINTHQFELVKDGLSQENYLKSSNSKKNTNSLIFDTNTSIITLNEENTDNNIMSSISLNFDLKTLMITGYYNHNDDDTNEFVKLSYNLIDGAYSCDSQNNCNKLQDKILQFVDETYNILEKCHKNINDFKK